VGRLLLLGAGGGGSVPVGTVDSYPMNGLSPTAAWSFSRNLLSSFGGTKYTDTAGAIDALNDQSGNSRNLSAVTTVRPTISTAGPNSRACGDFDGTDDRLSVSTAFTNLLSVSSGYMIATILIDTFPTNNATIYLNSAVMIDSSRVAGMTVRSGNILYSYNWDGNADAASGTVTTATAYVVEWRHEGGNVYQRVNGAGETSAASGNTSGAGSSFLIGGGGAGGGHLDGKIFEVGMWSTVPSLAQRDALVRDLGLWVGASV
jgi:hypothetical protein